MTTPRHPPNIEADLQRATRLEWHTLFWLVLIVVAMGWVAGGSQAFKTAWIEDLLSLLAPLLFIISRRIEKLGVRSGFPYGFHRAGTLAFFFAATALCVIGGLLLFEGLHALFTSSHPTVGSKRWFGYEVWIGWLMIGVLIFSVIPPVILGRKKRELARRLHDKVLFVDAETNAADWQTGIASILGVLGIAAGLWWADAVMASLISLSVLRDGIDALKGATISLLDGMPRELNSHKIDADAQALVETLEQRNPGMRAQVRETGRYLRARIEPEEPLYMSTREAGKYLEHDSWRLVELGEALRDREAPQDRTGD